MNIIFKPVRVSQFSSLELERMIYFGEFPVCDFSLIVQFDLVNLNDEKRLRMFRNNCNFRVFGPRDKDIREYLVRWYDKRELVLDTFQNMSTVQDDQVQFVVDLNSKLEGIDIMRNCIPITAIYRYVFEQSFDREYIDEMGYPIVEEDLRLIESPISIDNEFDPCYGDQSDEKDNCGDTYVNEDLSVLISFLQYLVYLNKPVRSVLFIGASASSTSLRICAQLGIECHAVDGYPMYGVEGVTYESAASFCGRQGHARAYDCIFVNLYSLGLRDNVCARDIYATIDREYGGCCISYKIRRDIDCRNTKGQAAFVLWSNDSSCSYRGHSIVYEPGGNSDNDHLWPRIEVCCSNFKHKSEDEKCYGLSCSCVQASLSRRVIDEAASIYKTLQLYEMCVSLLDLGDTGLRRDKLDQLFHLFHVQTDSPGISGVVVLGGWFWPVPDMMTLSYGHADKFFSETRKFRYVAMDKETNFYKHCVELDNASIILMDYMDKHHYTAFQLYVMELSIIGTFHIKYRLETLVEHPVILRLSSFDSGKLQRVHAPILLPEVRWSFKYGIRQSCTFRVDGKLFVNETIREKGLLTLPKCLLCSSDGSVLVRKAIIYRPLALLCTKCNETFTLSYGLD